MDIEKDGEEQGWRNSEHYYDPTPAQAKREIDDWAYQIERKKRKRRAVLVAGMVRGIVELSGFTWRGIIKLEDETGYTWIMNADHEEWRRENGRDRGAVSGRDTPEETVY